MYIRTGLHARFDADLRTISSDLPVLDLHGKQKQQKRTNTFFEFINAEHGTLIATDVAARGLDVRSCCSLNYLYLANTSLDPRS